MANDVKIRFRSFLPGAGFDSSGNPKQGKTRIVGEVAVTSYTEGGETLAPADVGLSNVDWIELNVRDETGSPSAQTLRRAVVVQSVNQFYLVREDLAGAIVEYAAAATETLDFCAEGDSAHDIELL